MTISPHRPVFFRAGPFLPIFDGDAIFWNLLGGAKGRRCQEAASPANIMAATIICLVPLSIPLPNDDMLALVLALIRGQACG